MMVSGLLDRLGPIAACNTQGKPYLLCDWAHCTCTEYYIYRVCILEVLN